MNGSIKDVSELSRFLQARRKQLKYEFYLPTIKELISHALNIVTHCTEREIHTIDECLSLSTTELYQISKNIGVFSRSCSYIIEGYYIGLVTLKHLGKVSFSRDTFHRTSREVFEMEKVHGRLIKYPESYFAPLIDNSLLYFENHGLVTLEDKLYQLVDVQQVDKSIEDFARNLLSLLSFKYKVEPQTQACT